MDSPLARMGFRICIGAAVLLHLPITVLCVGFLEDFVCATYFACVLWLVDVLLQKFGVSTRDVDNTETPTYDKLKRVMPMVFVFTSSWILFVAVVGPVAADLLLVRLRGVRFTFHEVISSGNNSAIDGMTSNEMKNVYMTAALSAIVAALFAIVRTFTSWSKLSRWNPIHAIVASVKSRLARKERRFQSVSTKSSSGGAENVDDNDEIVLELEESGRNSD
ncbi:hypothetical protein PC118_g13224 [Phytophthora cactorum]|uniref:Uncharacterized protein n=1 Tax=Phytophthora cactorum TaxID=29920 RepID=A0A8T1FKN7_9STRA|nr:hypothetical protein PC118_g13224 [Phytophthora cactorum]